MPRSASFSQAAIDNKKTGTAEYRRLHPEKVKAWKAAHYQRHKDKLRAQVYANRAKNKAYWLEQTRIYQQKRFEADPNYWRKKEVKRLYGISWDEYLALRKAQHDECAICRIPLSVCRDCVDHDHSIGKVRGILCDRCNVGLAMFRELPESLIAAATYLEHHCK